MTPRVLERAIIPLLLLITTTPALIKATNQNQTGYLPAVNQTVFPGFSTYSNAHFSLKYPSSWSVNNTSENQTTFLQNNIPHKGPRVDIRWTSQLAPPFNRDTWLSRLKNSGLSVTLLTNDSRYLSNSPAIVWDGWQGTLRQWVIVSNINGTSYILGYTSTFDNFVNYFEDFEVMWGTFHVK